MKVPWGQTGGRTTAVYRKSPREIARQSVGFGPGTKDLCPFEYFEGLQDKTTSSTEARKSQDELTMGRNKWTVYLKSPRIAQSNVGLGPGTKDLCPFEDSKGSKHQPRHSPERGKPETIFTMRRDRWTDNCCVSYIRVHTKLTRVWGSIQGTGKSVLSKIRRDRR